MASADSCPEVGDSRSAPNSDVQIYTVCNPSINVTNMKGKQEVRIVESTWNGREKESKFRFPKHSITMLRWKTELCSE